jgi:DnaK suppressor protein
MADEISMGEAERILKEREKATLDELKSLRESPAPSPVDGSMGRLSYIDAHQQHQMTLAGQRRLEVQLETIRGALARVKEGTYGKCVLCGEPVAPERLEAAPETPFCAPCKERLEREQH